MISEQSLHLKYWQSLINVLSSSFIALTTVTQEVRSVQHVKAVWQSMFALCECSVISFLFLQREPWSVIKHNDPVFVMFISIRELIMAKYVRLVSI